MKYNVFSIEPKLNLYGNVDILHLNEQGSPLWNQENIESNTQCSLKFM